MIVTVTLNPALDLTYTVDALVPHDTHRVATVAERAGGKGLNVARVLHALGEPVLATGLLGGPTGARVADLLAVEDVPASFVPIAGETRRTVAVVDPGDATGFWEPGPVVPGAEWSRFVDHFRSLLPEASVVALSGSLPPGVPIDGYAALIRHAAAAGVPAVLDTSGEALRPGLQAGPALAKPNIHELAGLFPAAFPPALLAPDLPAPGNHPAHDDDRRTDGRRPVDQDRLMDGARLVGSSRLAADLRRLTSGAVVISRGPDGLLAITPDGWYECAPPAPLAGNPTGAGDACVAALARGLRDGTAWPDLLADAVALAAAAVATSVAGAFDPDVYHRLRVTRSPLC